MKNTTIEIKREEIEKIVFDPFLNTFQQTFKIANLVLEKFNNKMSEENNND